MEDSIPPPAAIAPWDIVRVDFPYADQAATRRRAALVIATPSATDTFFIVWVLMITSAAQRWWPMDIPISDLRLGGMSHACVVRASKITSLDSRLPIRIGLLAPVNRPKVGACVGELLSNVLIS